MEIVGQTSSGEKKALKVEIEDFKKNTEYLHIEYKKSGEVEMKARLSDDEIVTAKAKLLFMIGETCYAAALKYYESEGQGDIGAQHGEILERFMQDLTDNLKAYHHLY
ncbi:hypothetical protein AALM99_06890 [Lactococcus muris]|uniref:Phage protein n=1 Tax=Lactococcus muris TaxID=2941330 RepID=A0ABV4DDB1_9LACT